MDQSIWRSLLFVPAHIEKFVAKAHARSADACILDLEDAVPLPQKAQARAGLVVAARAVNQRGTDVLVRVNADTDMMAEDLEALVDSAVCAVVLPKVNDANAVEAAAARLDALEAERGIALGHTRLIAQIEDVRALPNLDAIASASPRLMAMSLGSEDFSVSAGMAPTPETLVWPNQQIVFACRRAGILPFGFPGSIAEFSDVDAFRRIVVLARQMGFVGAFCVHPNQVAVLNDELAPSEAEVEYARGLLAACEQAGREGRGAFAYNGKMVDPPVVARAQEILSRCEAINARRRNTDLK